MNADQRLLAISFVVSATAYLLGCLAGALTNGVPAVALLSLFGLAANSVSYLLQLSGKRALATIPSVIAWGAGAGAGIILVVKL